VVIVDYFLIVEDVVIDERGRATLVNLAERMNVPKVPAGITGAKITFRFHPDHKAIVDQMMNFKIICELEDKPMWKSEADISVTVEENNGYAQVIPIDQMVFPEFGSYHIKLLIDDEEKASSIFIVRDSSELIEP